MKPNGHDLRLLRQAALRGITRHYSALDLTWIDDIPLLVPITGACENVSTLFTVSSSPDTYLTQTGQLCLEVELQEHDGVYCIVPSFRADEAGPRHLREFRLIEEEYSWASISGQSSYSPRVMLSVLLDRVRQAVSSILDAIVPELSSKGLEADHLLTALHTPQWPVITYREALVLLNESARFGSVGFGVDLQASHESALVSIVAERDNNAELPLFVTEYPENIKFFNMKPDPDDPSIVLSADLLLPLAGEAVGAAVREDDLAVLTHRLQQSSMLGQLMHTKPNAIDDFGPYLSLVASGRIPRHAGYGIGLERVLQYALGVDDIRDVSGPYQLAAQLRYEI